jgi:hypothetical protein
MAPPDTMAPRVFFVAHNRNHVRIFEGSAASLRTNGWDVQFAYVDGQADSDAAAQAAIAKGFPTVAASTLPRLAKAGDIACVGNDWGPKAFLRTLERLKRLGVMLFGVIEGARYAYSNHYQRVHRILCWGPSALETLSGEKLIVGSPAVEAALRSGFDPPAHASVLVNYKFTRGAAEQGPTWARAAAEAAIKAGAPYVISAHPLNVGELGGLTLSHDPFLPLLNASTLLVTRSSTAIYEALAARVSVVYFPIEGERRAEFGDAQGAFSTAENAADLDGLVQAHCRNPRFNDESAQAWLARHIDIQPERSASMRIADALQTGWREGLPASKLGLVRRSVEALRNFVTRFELHKAGAAR